MKTMRILIYIPQLIYGGAEKVLVSFANELVMHGHKVQVLELYERGLLKPQFDAQVTFDAVCSKAYTEKYYASLAQVKKDPRLLGKLLFSKIVGYRRFAEKLAAKRYADQSFDVAINYLETESPAFLLENIHAKMYLQWIHIDVGKLQGKDALDAFSPAWQKTDGVVCVSRVAKESFMQRYPELSDKTHLLYNFYDEAEIKRKGREPFSFVGDSPVLLSVGRMTEQKQYLRFLQVLARLRDEGYSFSWHVLGEGGQRRAIEEKIASLGLADRVFLHGLTDNPYKYMKNCDLFVLPSGWEGFPTVTVEAKALGCAVLATDVAGIREQLVHGKTGWIVDNDAEAIYEGIKRLLEDTALCESLRCSEGMEDIIKNESKYRAFIKLSSIKGETVCSEE